MNNCSKCGSLKVAHTYQDGTPFVTATCNACGYVEMSIAEFRHTPDETGSDVYIVYAIPSPQLATTEWSQRFRSLIPTLRDKRAEDFISELTQEGRVKIGFMYNADISRLRRKLDELGLQIEIENFTGSESVPIVRFTG